MPPAAGFQNIAETPTSAQPSKPRQVALGQTLETKLREPLPKRSNVQEAMILIIQAILIQRTDSPSTRNFWTGPRAQSRRRSVRAQLKHRAKSRACCVLISSLSAPSGGLMSAADSLTVRGAYKRPRGWQGLGCFVLDALLATRTQQVMACIPKGQAIHRWLKIAQIANENWNR